MSPYNDLEAQILSCFEQDDLSDVSFNKIALLVFGFQYKNNPAYQNYCSAIGSTPETVSHWNQIPPLPTDAFKSTETVITSFPARQIKHTFLTSGTTSEVPGKHNFPSLSLYEASIRYRWKQLNLPKVARGIFLTPSPASAPNSSLSHMMGVLESSIASESIWLLKDNGELDDSGLVRYASEKEPLFLLGTAISFLGLFDRLTEPIKLPKASMVMETGGYKGSHRNLEKTELYQLFKDKLGLHENSIINEYSMTELSSQFYTQGIGDPHYGPPWTRTRVIDPRTGADSAPGSLGYLVIYDLANLYSVMAIQTQDIAVAHNDGSFTLMGRDPSALPRGCSRSADS